jgi:DNA-binding MarR family transcriptional regulator
MAQASAKQPTPDQLLSCTCFRLRKVTRQITQMYDQALAPLEITITQFSLLAYLFMRGEVSIGELTAEMLMDPTTLTRTLRPLERRKLLKITTARDDRRRRSVLLSEAGRATFRDAVPLWRQGAAQMTGVLGPPSLAALNQALGLTLDSLTKA